MLKISVKALTDDPREVFADIKNHEVELGSDVKVLEKIKGNFQIQRLGFKVIVRGLVTTRVRLACARCLQEYELPLLAKMLVLALPVSSPENLDSEHEESDQNDPAIIHYIGEQFDLLPEIQSALILALPMKPLCQDDCPGLCPVCGQRLIAGHCDCTRRAGPGNF
jgi:uncharacterized protein